MNTRTVGLGKSESQQASWSSIIRDPVIDKLLVNIAFTWLSVGVGSNLVYFFIPYLDKGVDSLAHYGIYYMVFQIVMSVTLPLAGVLTDRIGRRPILMLGASINVVGTLVLPFAAEWWHLLYASALQAVGFALLGTAQACVVADVSSGYKREKCYSITMSFSMIFNTIGMVALTTYSALYQGTLPDNFYYTIPLMAGAVLALLAAIPMFMIRIPRRSPGFSSESVAAIREADVESNRNSGISRAGQSIAGESGPEKGGKRYEIQSRLGANSVVLRMIAIQGIIGFGAGFIVPLFAYYFEATFKLPQFMVFLILLLGNFGTALGVLTAPWMAKRVARLGGRVGTIAACQLASIICAGYLAVVPYYLSLSLAVVTFVVRQSLANMASPLMSALTMDHTPGSKRGKVSSLTQLAFNVPNGVSPSLSRLLIYSVPLPFGYSYSILIQMVAYSTSTILLLTTRNLDRLLVTSR